MLVLRAEQGDLKVGLLITSSQRNPFETSERLSLKTVQHFKVHSKLWRNFFLKDCYNLSAKSKNSKYASKTLFHLKLFFVVGMLLQFLRPQTHLYQKEAKGSGMFDKNFDKTDRWSFVLILT